MANSKISSTRFDAPLSVELNPSLLLRRLVLLGGAAALAGIVVLPWPLLVRSIGGIALILVGLLEWRRTTGARPTALRWEEGPEWSAKFRGDWRPAADLRCTHLSASLVVIEATVPGRRRCRYAIFRDQADAQSWRRLRRRLQRPADPSFS